MSDSYEEIDGFGQYSKLVENAKNYSICLFMNVKWSMRLYERLIWRN